MRKPPNAIQVKSLPTEPNRLWEIQKEGKEREGGEERENLVAENWTFPAIFFFIFAFDSSSFFTS